MTRSLLRRSVLIGLSICAPTAAIAHADGQTALVKLQPGADPVSLGVDVRPVVAPDVARRLRRDAGRMGRRSPDLGRWVVASVPPGGVAELRARPGVDAATVIQDTPPSPPQDICRTIPAGFGRPPVDIGDGLVPDLDQFDDVRRAFGMTSLPLGGQGAGIRVADIEYEWEPDHVELAGRELRKPRHDPQTPPQNVSHGTSALTLIGGVADGEGITGLASAAELLPITPWSGSTYSPATAIASAADQLRPGDVMLIEQQSHQRGPADTGAYGEAVAAAIAAATAKGIVVVLPAGNGGGNIADYGIPATDTALVVGGGETGNGGGVLGRRSSLSNAGARIDVQGPAHAVVTGTSTPSYYGFLLVGGATPRRAYTHCFNGTSSASAAVAGAVAAVQGLALQRRGAPFTPAELRQRLVLTGRPQPDPENGWVGPIPQVVAAADLDPPSAPTITAPLGGTVAAGRLQLRWASGVDGPGGSGAGVDRVLLDGAVAAELPNGAGTIAVTIGVGPHTITVQSFDLAGNAAERSVAVTGVAQKSTVPVPVSTGVPDPPSVRADQRPAGVVRRAAWNRSRGLLVLRVRAVRGATVRVAGRKRPVRGGLVRVRLRRPAVRVVQVRAPGYAAVRYRVAVRRPGRAAVRLLSGVPRLPR
ncbi:MAG: S8 family serine peptidase [Thermoleophilia bacterium]